MSDEEDDDIEGFDDGLVEVSDLAYMADQMRRQAIVEFNELYKKDGIILKNNSSTNTGKMTKKKLEKIIKIEKVVEIIKEKLPYNQITENYSCNITLFWECVNAITKNIFYIVAGKLVDAGIYEMIFDPKTNDFAWRMTKTFSKIIEGKKRKKRKK